MKNAMKKLTSLLLVAVLLVGALPLGASASGFVNPAENWMAPAAAPAAVPAPVAEPAAQNDAAKVAFDLIITYADGTVRTEKCNMAVGTTAYQALCSILTTSVADDLLANNNAAIINDTVASGMGPMKVTFTAKEVVVAQDKITLKIHDTATVKTKVFERGTVLDLNKNLVVNTYGLTLPDGHDVTYFTIGDEEVKGQYTVTKDNVEIVVHTALTGSNNGGSSTPATAAYVDVILVSDNRTSGFAENEYHRCVLVNGKITENDRTAIAAKMPAGTVAWKRGDKGTQSSSLVNFDFSDLSSPINVFPVVQSSTSGNGNGNGNGTGTGSNNVTTGTVIFKKYDNSTMYTANITNGKLNATDVNNAHNAANRAGYTFNGWKVNGAGTAAASDLLLNMTFNNGDYLVPTYTEIPNSTITSTKNQNDIFLNIFVNKDFQHCKTIKLNDHWVIADDKITKDEILQYVVTDYYKASNTNLGLQADKLYYSVGSFMYNWLTDNGTTVIDDITTKRSQGTVTVNIMVTNAVAKNGSAADTSNPKTGDDIYTAMTVMGLSAASLAAVMFFYNKKRYTV